jgi:hypothetical protein
MMSCLFYSLKFIHNRRIRTTTTEDDQQQQQQQGAFRLGGGFFELLLNFLWWVSSVDQHITATFLHPPLGTTTTTHGPPSSLAQTDIVSDQQQLPHFSSHLMISAGPATLLQLTPS